MAINKINYMKYLKSTMIQDEFDEKLIETFRIQWDNLYHWNKWRNSASQHTWFFNQGHGVTLYNRATADEKKMFTSNDFSTYDISALIKINIAINSSFGSKIFNNRNWDWRLRTLRQVRNTLSHKNRQWINTTDKVNLAFIIIRSLAEFFKATQNLEEILNSYLEVTISTLKVKRYAQEFVAEKDYEKAILCYEFLLLQPGLSSINRKNICVSAFSAAHMAKLNDLAASFAAQAALV